MLEQCNVPLQPAVMTLNLLHMFSMFMTLKVACPSLPELLNACSTANGVLTCAELFSSRTDLLDACSDPASTNGPEFAALFGECIFSMYTHADMDLTMEMQAAAAAANFPARYAVMSHDISVMKV